MHNHFIGLIHLTEDSELATYFDVVEDIISDLQWNKGMMRMGYGCGRAVFTPQQYTDFRCSTNLERFKYCPVCGEKIDWMEVTTKIEEELEKREYEI